MDLDLWRPDYKPGDLVWILGKTIILPGEVLKKHGGIPNPASKYPRQGAKYYCFCREALKLHKSMRARSYAVSVTLNQLVPRMFWEMRPLQRLEIVLFGNQEVTVEKLRDYVESHGLAGDAGAQGLGHDTGPGGVGPVGEEGEAHLPGDPFATGA